MNTSALVMMIISIVLLWGGLVLSVIHLAKIRKNQKTKNLHINLLFYCKRKSLSSMVIMTF